MHKVCLQLAGHQKTPTKCIKTEVILLGCRSLLNSISFPGLQVDGRLIPASLTVRSLGVYLDASLTMETHVNKIRAAVFSRFRTMGRVRKLLTPVHRMMVVKSLVISHLSYCASLLAGINATFVTADLCEGSYSPCSWSVQTCKHQSPVP